MCAQPHFILQCAYADPITMENATAVYIHKLAHYMHACATCCKVSELQVYIYEFINIQCVVYNNTELPYNTVTIIIAVIVLSCYNITAACML